MINTWTCAPNPAANHHRRVDTVSLTSCKITKNYLVRHYQLYNVYIFLTAYHLYASSLVSIHVKAGDENNHHDQYNCIHKPILFYLTI